MNLLLNVGWYDGDAGFENKHDCANGQMITEEG